MRRQLKEKYFNAENLLHSNDIELEYHYGPLGYLKMIFGGNKRFDGKFLAIKTSTTAVNGTSLNFLKRKPSRSTKSSQFPPNLVEELRIAQKI